MKNPRAFSRMQGLSLIELMIAVVLGSLVVVAVGNVYVSSTRSFRTQEGMARMQEGARFAFETIGFDLRQAGFGCRSVSAAPVDATWWYKNLFTRPMQGYENGAGSPTAALDVDNTDSIRILRADKNRETTITAPGTTNAAHGMSANGLVVISDAYADATVYVATAAAGTGYTLGAATPCTAAAVPDTAEFHLLPLAAHIYYIRNNPSGEPSLYRQTLQSGDGDGDGEPDVTAEELVEGVEDMQILYGEDTSQATVATCPDDGCSADAYVAADAVVNWNRVVSERITLTMRTADNLSTDTSGADRRIRRTFTTTIAMRNRLL